MTPEQFAICTQGRERSPALEAAMLVLCDGMPVKEAAFYASAKPQSVHNRICAIRARDKAIRLAYLA